MTLALTVWWVCVEFGQAQLFQGSERPPVSSPAQVVGKEESDCTCSDSK